MHDPVVDAPQAIPQPEYTLLENTDSLKYSAIIIYTRNVNINTIAKNFYGSNVFWPYIFIENQNVDAVKRNPLDIPNGLVLKIPRIPANLIDPDNSYAIERAKMLSDSILTNTVIQ